MSTDSEDLEFESGSSLRRKLEAQLEKNQELSKELSSYKAQAVIVENGFSLVKPEDISDAKPDEMISAAEAVQEKRLSEREDVVRDILSQKGFTGEELDQAAQEMLNPSDADLSAYSRAKETSAIGGNATPLKDPRTIQPGLSRIEYALESKAKK